MSPIECFSAPLWQAWALTLMHFLWQGLVIVGLLAVVLRVFAVRHARTRYVLCLAAMMLMATCPLVTWSILEVWPAENPSLGPAVAAESIDPFLWDDDLLRSSRSTSDRAVTTGLLGSIRRCLRSARAAQPFLIAGWITGVFLLSARLLLSLIGVHWCKRGGLPPQ